MRWQVRYRMMLAPTNPNCVLEHAARFFVSLYLAALAYWLSASPNQTGAVLTTIRTTVEQILRNFFRGRQLLNGKGGIP
jgi:hypothetical protein